MAPAWKDRFWAAFDNVDGKQYIPEAEGAVMISKEWWHEAAQ